ncbi:hypothetical protein BACCIP111895_04783 [Neobacillus rhizosphaerae]|uniref:DUF4179 domain-containing protein n=1 Tax=Neobacillus rhizosphaerae TaxID=2880965 RepID=A0ABM9EY18_9BACI|nr:hypothetical protein [Neobacillus rhizosphaerae]CAH2717569.1 hypothetical protein BACCIP111895_04783 [Neobacillus rhizosphaerae]
MSHLSDKELLEVLADFPRHELTTIQRTEILKTISETGTLKPKRQFPVQRLAALAAVFILILITPILYLTNKSEEKTPRAGTVIKQAQEGNYFALVDKDGTPHYADSNFGIPNKVSLLAPKEWAVWGDIRSSRNTMVFLWGKELKSYQYLNVEATHVDTGISTTFGGGQLSGGMYGSDAHASVDLGIFDKRGKWNLTFIVGNTSGVEKKFGEFTIYVKDHYVLLGPSATLLISQEDLYVGFYQDAYIEVDGENLPEEIELEIINEEDPTDISKFTFKHQTDSTSEDGRKTSIYKGDFQIKKSGKYSFGALGSSNFVRIGKPTDK